MDALRVSLKEEIESTDKTIIIDGHYSHDLLDNPSLVVVLRKAPWELQEKLQLRLYGYEKVWENLDAEIMGVIAFETQGKFPIECIHEENTTGKTPQETAEDILAVIRGEKNPSIEPIDWVTYPETLRVLVNRTCILS
jgi:adenylate kinase